MKVDWLIAGAGFSGAVLAERIATQLDQTVLLVDRRDHIGGNAYDYIDDHGVMVQLYGPHLFHTNDARVWNYLSQFTEWTPYYHHVLGIIDGQWVPIPFNLNTLYALFPPRYAGRLEDQLISEFGFNTKVPILKMRESASAELKFLADYVYKKIFENYTMKQWGFRPEELGPAVTGRVPVSISRDDRYFTDSFQAMPKRGFTAMFARMLKHKNIKVLLNTDYRELKGAVDAKRMIYTGPIDGFFDDMHGALPYRSLRFEFLHAAGELVQPVATMNYPNEQPFTRISEFKHMYGPRVTDGTVLVREYPQPYIAGENEAYYPIPREENQVLFEKYQAEVDKLKGSVLFVGRLADYKYYNMDQAVARALMVFDKRIAAGL